MRFSRGQNPSRGNEPEPQETPDSATPETGPRGGERASWFAPLPPEPLPSEHPQDASGVANRGTSADRPRTSPPPVGDSFDPNDLYPPEYRPGGAREASRASNPRDAYGQGQGREPAAPRTDDRGSANRDAYERSMRPRTTTTGNQRSNARPGGRDTPPSPPISEQFGWQTPEWERNRTPPAPPRPPPLSAHWEEREERIRQEESGELPRISPPGAGAYNPNASGVRPTTPSTNDPAAFTNDGGAYSPYSQQFILPPHEAREETSGQTTYSSASPGTFPAPFPGQGEPERAYRPDSFAPGGETRSEPVYNNNGAPVAPFSLTHSGRLATTGRPGTSGAFTAVSGMPPFAAPSRGARTADMPVRGLVTDPVVWSFLGLAFVLTAAMVAFVMLRYDSFPQQITLHFGPAGASQRDRIGERRELWTIPFLSVIVFLANTALAFVFDFFDRHDRFVPRLLAIGSALVSAVAWVVLLTLLYR